MRRQIPFRKEVEGLSPPSSRSALGFARGRIQRTKDRRERKDRKGRVGGGGKKEKAGEDDEGEKFAGKAVDTSISLPFFRFPVRNVRRIHVSKPSIA